MERLSSVASLVGSNPGPAEGAIRLLLVRCGPYRLGFPMGLVRGVVAESEIVSLGLSGLEGLMWRDGALLPATRLGPLLGLQASEPRVPGHGVLAHSEGGLLCFMVDEALDLIEVPAASIKPLPPLVLRAVSLSGLDSAATLEGLLLIVNPVQLLGADRAADLMGAAARIGDPSIT